MRSFLDGRRRTRSQSQEALQSQSEATSLPTITPHIPSETPNPNPRRIRPAPQHRFHPDLRGLVASRASAIEQQQSRADERQRSVLRAQGSPTADIRRKPSRVSSGEAGSRRVPSRNPSLPTITPPESASTFGPQSAILLTQQLEPSPDATRRLPEDQVVEIQDASANHGSPLSPPPQASRTPTKLTPLASPTMSSSSSSPNSPGSPNVRPRSSPPSSRFSASLAPENRISAITDAPPRTSFSQNRASQSSVSVSQTTRSRPTSTIASSTSPTIPTDLNAPHAPFRVSFVGQVPPRNTPSPPSTFRSQPRSIRSRASTTPPSIRLDETTPETLSPASPSSPSVQPARASSVSPTPGAFSRLAGLIHSPSRTFTRQRDDTPTPTNVSESSATKRPSASPLAHKKARSSASLGGTSTQEKPKTSSVRSARPPIRHASDSPLSTRSSVQQHFSPTSSALPFTFKQGNSPNQRGLPGPRGRMLSSPGHILTTPTRHQDQNRRDSQHEGKDAGEQRSPSSPLGRRTSADWSSKAASAAGPASWQKQVAEEMVRLSVFQPGALGEPKASSPPATVSRRHRSKDKLASANPPSSAFGPQIDVPVTNSSPAYSRYTTASEGDRENIPIREGSGSPPESKRSSRPHSSSHGSSGGKASSKGKGRSRPETKEERVKVHVVGEDPDPEHLVQAWRLSLEIPTARLDFVDEQSGLMRFGSRGSDEDKDKRAGEGTKERDGNGGGLVVRSSQRRSRRRARERTTSGGSGGVAMTKRGSRRRTPSSATSTSLSRPAADISFNLSPPLASSTPIPSYASPPGLSSSSPGSPSPLAVTNSNTATSRNVLPPRLVSDLPRTPTRPHRSSRTVRAASATSSQPPIPSLVLSSPTNPSPSKGKGKRPVETDDEAAYDADMSLNVNTPNRPRKISNVSEMGDKLGELPPYRRKRFKRSDTAIRLQSLASVAADMSRETSSPVPGPSTQRHIESPRPITPSAALTSPTAGPSSEAGELRGILSNKTLSGVVATEPVRDGHSRASSRRSHSVSFSRPYSPDQTELSQPSPSTSAYPPSAFGRSVKSMKKQQRRASTGVITPGGTIPMLAILSPRPPSMAAGRTGSTYHLKEPKRYSSHGSGILNANGNQHQHHTGPSSIRKSGGSVDLGSPLDNGPSFAHGGMTDGDMEKQVHTRPRSRSRLPPQGWAFFLGFVMPLVWWVAALWRVRENAAMSHPIKDVLTWRKRCRLMAGFSILVYVPVITLAVIFGR